MTSRFIHLPLIALDRDGTLIREGDYLKDPKKVKLFSGVPESLRRLKQAGYKVVVLSNQSGVGRGIITLQEMRVVLRQFQKLLRRHGVTLDGYFQCIHHPRRRCACRKPGLKMLRQAARCLGVSWKGAISIGDRPSDVQVGQRAGGKGLLVLTGYGRRWIGRNRAFKPNHVSATFQNAVDWILKNERGPL
ncbi:MAG: HAD family hydrolase [Elusimicrobiota bacterium]|jgi:histidinol-phosphate phosphatase family protein